MPALLGALLAALLALGSGAGLAGLVGAVLLVQAGVALAVSGLDVPAAGAAAALAALTGAVATVGTAADPAPRLVVLAGSLGIAFLLALVLQLLRRDGRARLASSLALAASALVLTALPAFAVAAWQSAGPAVVALGAVASGVVLLSELVPMASPRARLARRLVALAAVAGGAAVLAGPDRTGAASGPGAGAAVAAGTVAAGTAAVVVLVLSALDRAEQEQPSGDGPAFARRGRLVGLAAVPIACAAPVTYALGSALLG